MSNITRDMITNARNGIASAITDRLMWEMEHNPNHDDFQSIADYLTRFQKNVLNPAKTDAFGILYFAEHPFDFEAIFKSQRRSGACFNVYAMPKALKAGGALRGSALDLNDPDCETIAGIMLALASGITLQKLLANAVNDFMMRPSKSTPRTKQYASGGTQGSSALRALEALGVVRQTGFNTWGAADPVKFARMVDASKGLSAHAAAQQAAEQARQEELASVPAPTPAKRSRAKVAA